LRKFDYTNLNEFNTPDTNLMDIDNNYSKNYSIQTDNNDFDQYINNMHNEYDFNENCKSFFQNSLNLEFEDDLNKVNLDYILKDTSKEKLLNHKYNLEEVLKKIYTISTEFFLKFNEQLNRKNIDLISKLKINKLEEKIERKCQDLIAKFNQIKAEETNKEDHNITENLLIQNDILVKLIKLTKLKLTIFHKIQVEL